MPMRANGNRGFCGGGGSVEWALHPSFEARFGGTLY